jgi:hypothetical protein
MDRQEEIIAKLNEIQKTLNIFAASLGAILASLIMIGVHFKLFWWQ